MTSLKISILPCGDKYPLCLWGHFQISVLTSALCGPIYIFILKDEIDHQQGLGLSSTLADRIFWATIFQRYCCCCLFVNWTIFAYDTIVTIRIDRCAHGQCPHRRTSSRLEKKPTMNSWTRHVLCDSVLSYGGNRWKFEHVVRNSMGNEIWSIFYDKYFEIWIFYT